MKSLANQLKKLDVCKLKMKSGQTLEQELQRHADILRDCINDRLKDEVYSVRDPKMYERTYRLMNALEVEVKPKWTIIDGKSFISLSLKYNELSKSEGLFGQEADLEVLLNEGYSVKKDVWFKSIEGFGYREPSYYIDKAIEDYQAKVSNPFPVRLHINDEVREFKI